MKILTPIVRRATAWVAGWLLLLSPLRLTAAEGQPLQGHVPAAVAGLASVGRLAGTHWLPLAIGLPLRNQPGLTNLLAQMYRPGSTHYHHFLSAAEFADRFGPLAANYKTLMAYVQAEGLTITGIHSNRMLLDVAGPVSQIERTLHVHLRLYPHPREHRQFFAPDQEPRLDLPVSVLHISGLDNFQLPHPMNLARRAAAPLDRPGLGSAPGGAYGGNDFRTAYVPGTRLTGQGQRVALLQLSSGFYAGDITRYLNQAGLPNVPVTAVLVDGYDGGPGTANDECSLDIEMTLAMAPGLLGVQVYEGPVPDDILNQMAMDDQAQQLSSSWAFPVDGITDQIFQEFAAQGQSFFNASGDDDAYVGVVTQPSDDPNITIVGGTTLTTDAHGAWVAEKVWQLDATNGSGGGISTMYPIPAWQQGVDMTLNQGSTMQRNLPDVALTADNVYVCYGNGTNGVFSGTSCAAPLWAGFTALANQQAVNNGVPAVGFANPTIYSLGQATNNAHLFHDITNGNNTSVDSPNLYYAVPGYDLCTGWGTPAGQSLIDALVGPALPTPPFVISQPQGQTVVAGINVTLSVLAAGAPPLGYQWTDNGTNLAGATNAVLSLPNTQLNQSGNYVVRVSNAFGMVLSSSALLRVVSPSSCDPTPAGLVSWWAAEGNTIDVLGLNSGTANGALGYYPHGEVGQAFVFDGTNSSVAVPASPSLDIGAAGSGITIECWIQPSALNVTGPGGPLMEWDSASADGLGFWCDGTLNADLVDTFSFDHPIQTGSGLLNTNRWQHVALTYDEGSGDAFIYLNGSVVAAQNLGSFVPQTSYPANVGQRTAPMAGGGDNYAGLMDELTIYNRALGATEIQAIYLTGSGGKCFAPPLVVGQPTNQTANVGDTPGFAVNATGSGPLFYQWLFQGGPLPGATNAFLSLADVQPGQAGNYAVLVTNEFGMVLSDNASLTINPPAGCAPVPVGMAGWWAAEGNTLDTLGLNSGTANGALGYTAGEVGQAFVLDGSSSYIAVPASPSLDIGATGSGITIECWIQPNDDDVNGYGGPLMEWDASDADGLQFWADGRLRANLKDTLGQAHLIQSATGLLDVNNWQHVALTYDMASGSALIYLNGAVVAAQNPGSFIPQTSYPANIGQRTAHIDGFGDSYGGWLDELSIYNRALGASEIQAIYQAGSAGKCFTPPVIVTQPAAQPAAVGSSVTLGVTADGTATMSYQWTFQGASLTGATNRFLNLTNVQFSQAGNYSVWVTNIFGSGQSSNAVLMVGAPPALVAQPTNLTVRLGSQAGFGVSASGTSPLAYQWQYQGINLNGATNATLTLPNVQFAQAGNYSVQVTNTFGVALSSNVWLTVLGLPPVITAQPTNLAVLPGKTATFNVTATGTGLLFYHWLFNGTNNLTGATNATLTLTNIQTAQTGNYSVTITNLYGQTNSTNAILSFLAPPQIIGQPVGLNVKVGVTATFKVGATGATPLFFQWYLNSTNNPIPGATSSLFGLVNVQFTNAGIYILVVTNLAGAVISSNAVLTVHLQDHFAWATIPSPKFVSGPFTTIIQAQNVTNGLVTNFTGTVSLTDTSGVPILPVISGNFVRGMWTGTVAVAQSASNLVLKADDGLSDTGLANAITVINPPALAGARAGNFLLFSWPTNPGGFAVQTAGRLNATNWVQVTSPPALLFGTQYMLSVPITRTNAFYRLFNAQP